MHFKANGQTPEIQAKSGGVRRQYMSVSTGGQPQRHGLHIGLQEPERGDSINLCWRTTPETWVVQSCPGESVGGEEVGLFSTGGEPQRHGLYRDAWMGESWR